MSEFSEKHTVSRLFGAPPGFVGFEEGGQLTEKVRRKPFSVVLFDEIEKAHPDIFNSLLQILEEGRLTDGQGRVVDFKNTVIIMTTNLGTRDIARGALGFSLEGNSQNDYELMKGKVNEELKKHFKPEFLNRVDETIVFPQLSKDELRQIVDLFLKRLSERLEDRDMTIELSQEAKDKLIELGFDPALGARPLRRAVQREVEDKLSEKILHGELASATHVKIDLVAGEFVFTAKPRIHESVTQ
jgi:ATP-dependent Clp protease ATP-binding subunit ClpC